MFEYLEKDSAENRKKVIFMKQGFSVYRNSKGWDQRLPEEMDSSASVVFIFASPHYFSSMRETIDDIIKRFPLSHIIGCSTAGEIVQKEFSDGVLICAVLQFEHTRLASSSLLNVESHASFESGQKLAES